MQSAVQEVADTGIVRGSPNRIIAGNFLAWSPTAACPDTPGTAANTVPGSHGGRGWSGGVRGGSIPTRRTSLLAPPAIHSE